MIDREVSLSWHLTSNHYPPLPASLIETAENAIDACNEYEPERRITLPDGCTVNEQAEMEAWDVVEWLHLEFYLDDVE